MKTLNIFLAVAMIVVVLGCGGRKADVDEVITTITEADTIVKNADEMQEAEMPETIELEKLQLKGDVYYFNDVAYSGKATRETKSKHYWEEKTETWEMKNGKFHGEYSENAWEAGILGNYKDGKKHGEWQIYHSHWLEVQHYKDGKKHGEWMYFDHSESEESYKIEIYENDVLIEERTIKNKDSFTDARDGKKYKIVKIGDQIWMAENLNYKIGNSWCYDNKDANCKKYGRLYTWNAAMKACPEGWRLPDREDWRELTRAVDANAAYTGDIPEHYRDIDNDAGEKLKSRNQWLDGGENGNLISGVFTSEGGNWSLIEGTDEFGFSALPGGIRYRDSGFNAVGFAGNWWVATPFGNFSAVKRQINYCFRHLSESYNHKGEGLSVRCIKCE